MTTRLPINALMYLAIAGLAGASAWQFYLTFQEQRAAGNNEVFQSEALAEFRKHMEIGQSRQPDRKVWNPELHRDALREANWTGKLPPPPPDEAALAAAEEAEAAAKPAVPLDEIFMILGLFHEAGTLAPAAPTGGAGATTAGEEDAGDDADDPFAEERGNQTSIVIAYLPEANVEPPPEVLEALGETAPGAGFRPADTVATNVRGRGRNAGRGGNRGGNRGGSRGRTAGRASSAMPTFSGNALTHTVYLDETLWPPFEHIRLVGVDEEGHFAVFQREDGPESEDGYEQEKLFKSELGLPQQVLAQLTSMGGEARERPSGAGGEADVPAPTPRSNDWIPGSRTRRIGDDVHVGEEFAQRVRAAPESVFNEIGVRPYTSRGGSVKGLQVSNVPPSLQSFGVSRGDVIISVNGQPVQSKSQAYSVGKKQYQRGERSFKVEMISNGQRVERTILAPNDA